MYTPDINEISEFNIRDISQFVEFWSPLANIKVFEHGNPAEIVYLSELNIDADLTENNIRKLVRWKDPLRLTQPVMTDSDNGRSNPKVEKILKSIKSLNDFRHDVLTDDEIRKVVAEIFPNGVVYPVFLLHIAKPHLYPIVDQHVFRSYSVHKKVKFEITWETYDDYRKYFSELASGLGIEEVSANVSQLKEIDNALMSFGRFLQMFENKKTAEPIPMFMRENSK